MHRISRSINNSSRRVSKMVTEVVAVIIVVAEGTVLAKVE